MVAVIRGLNVDFKAAFIRFFRARDVFFHDGAGMRRLHISFRLQALGAVGGMIMALLALFGVAQIFGAAPMVAAVLARDAEMLKMHTEVVAMRDEMQIIRKEAKAHAARLDSRQAFLDAVVTGKAKPVELGEGAGISKKTAAVIRPLAGAEMRQVAMAQKAQSAIDQRYAEVSSKLSQVGISATRLTTQPAVGGPYEPVDTTATKGAADPAFRSLFQSWKRLETLERGTAAIPSEKPVDVMSLTSSFGVRSDPFRGGAAMHAGVDIPGAHGSAIYATADGIVERAGWANGYGNLVALDHGRGIETRYGHLSAILVVPGQRVTRGQVIARMGSTGRSTGTHLHYEVRLDGQPVNPIPFMQGTEYAAAPAANTEAKGGPAN